MFRAIAALLFIVLILPLAALTASVVMNVLGISGVLGFLVGFPVFVGLLAAAVMVLAAVNDRINDTHRFDRSRGKTHTNGAH